MSRALSRIEQDMNNELRQQMNVLLSCSAVALHEKGFDKGKILQMFEAAKEVWKECSSTNDVSMMQMLEQETEIEIQIGDGKSWRDVSWQNAKIWDGQMPTVPQLIYIRQQQRKWIPAMVMGMMLIAVKRTESWEYDELVSLMIQVDGMRDRYKAPKKAAEKMTEMTGITAQEVDDIWA